MITRDLRSRLAWRTSSLLPIPRSVVGFWVSCIAVTSLSRVLGPSDVCLREKGWRLVRGKRRVTTRRWADQRWSAAAISLLLGAAFATLAEVAEEIATGTVKQN